MTANNNVNNQNGITQVTVDEQQNNLGLILEEKNVAVES